VITYLKRYIVSSLRHWIEEKKYVESKPIRIAKQYIGENYYQALTLEKVSKNIGFNPTYFSTMFKKETGMNFSDYLKKVRIDNAKNMLLDTEQQVEDISYAVGYSDIKYFSRLFKKLAGVTPTEFRRLYN
jgi:two-component system response regulator YesN